MKKSTLLLFIIAFSFYSCGKGKELENCEYYLELNKKELESTKAKYNQLVNQYNELLELYQTVENEKASIVIESKSDINEIIRKLDWDSYNSKDEMKNDLDDIEVMNY